jgi:hypothetical protein
MREISILDLLVQSQNLSDDRSKIAVLTYQDSRVVLIVKSINKHMRGYLNINALLCLVLDCVSLRALWTSLLLMSIDKSAKVNREIRDKAKLTEESLLASVLLGIGRLP